MTAYLERTELGTIVQAINVAVQFCRNCTPVAVHVHSTVPQPYRDRGSVAVRCGAVLYVTVYVQRDRTASRLILRYRPERQIVQISAKFRFSV